MKPIARLFRSLRSVPDHELTLVPDSYTPLNKDRHEVRLLAIRAGARKSMLDCVLYKVALRAEEAPTYETISYCWGDATHVAWIRLNGFRVQIPVQAVAALRAARRVDRSRVVWIDSLCINQRDETEQGHQVDMMIEIYKQSVNNLIYLGDDHVDVAMVAIEAIQVIVDFRKAYLLRLREIDNHKEFSSKLAIARSVAANIDSLKPSVKWVYSSQWFRRLWTVQEYLLAPRNTVICTDFEADFSSLVDASRTFLYLHGELGWQFNDEVWRGMHAAFELGRWRAASRPRHSKAGTSDGSLLELLTAFGPRECTRPHDKVYGLLGLYRNVIGTRELPHCLQPDYKRNPHEMIFAATRYAMIEKGRFDIHRYVVRRSPTAQHFSSWMRDWNRQHVYLERDEAPFFSQLTSSPACGDGQLRILSSPDESVDLRILRVQGIPIIATLDEISPILFPSAYEDLFTYATQMRDKLSLSYETLATTLTGEGVDNALSRMLDFGAIREIAECPTIMDVGYDPDPDPETVDTYDVEPFTDALNNTCPWRRLFSTDRGHLGIGPRTAEKGDVLAVIAGCELPVIIRPEVPGYRLVGPAYVNGISHGEAVATFLRRGGKLVEYELV